MKTSYEAYVRPEGLVGSLLTRKRKRLAQARQSLQQLVDRFSPGIHLDAEISDEQEFNAYAITINGSRSIVVTTGLMRLLAVEGLHFVVAHEVAHHLLNHSTTTRITFELADQACDFIENSSLASKLSLPDFITDSAISSVARITANAGLNFQSRSMEFEADTKAIELLKSRNMALSGSLEVFEIISSLEGKKGAFDQIQTNLFGTHPLTPDRIENIKFLLAKERSVNITKRGL